MNPKKIIIWILTSSAFVLFSWVILFQQYQIYQLKKINIKILNNQSKIQIISQHHSNLIKLNSKTNQDIINIIPILRHRTKHYGKVKKGKYYGKANNQTINQTSPTK